MATVIYNNEMISVEEYNRIMMVKGEEVLLLEGVVKETEELRAYRLARAGRKSGEKKAEGQGAVKGKTNRREDDDLE